jgi:hypothetical protein
MESPGAQKINIEQVPFSLLLKKSQFSSKRSPMMHYFIVCRWSGGVLSNLLRQRGINMQKYKKGRSFLLSSDFLYLFSSRRKTNPVMLTIEGMGL